jgi:hypothetical protein
MEIKEPTASTFVFHRFLPGGQAPALDGAWQKGSRTLALLLLRSQQVAEVQRRVVEKTSPGLNKL